MVPIVTQRWALNPWQGEPDPPGLPRRWARKGKFTVGGSRSCAELAIVDHLRLDGWQGVWVNTFGPLEFRREWFPAPAHRTLAEAGAPVWAAGAFDRLRAANGGRLGGFFDVLAWREPGEIRFAEAKVGSDPIKRNQRAFVKAALALYPPEAFMIIHIPLRSAR
ncbi:MAG: hypothetical protein ACRDRJ_00690 [Streptosporangiaceae bacterium]